MNSIVSFQIFREDEDNENFSFKNVISEKVHHSYKVERMNVKGKYIIRKLFEAYYKNPQQLPDHFIMKYMINMRDKSNNDTDYVDLASLSTSTSPGNMRIAFEKFRGSWAFLKNKENQIALMRIICDHIAGMTDHYAIIEYEQLYE